MKWDEFWDFAMKLREKNKKYKVMKKELEEIRAELNILSRTENLLTSRAGDIDDFLKQLEREKGISGYTNINKKAEDIAIQKWNLDQAKDKNLEELTKLVENIEN